MKKLKLIIIMCLCIFNIGYAQTFYCQKIKGEEILTNKEYLTISYNHEYNVPNYVGETLTLEMTKGDVPRMNYFYSDHSIITHASYAGIGYDRGHMAPAADFKGCPTGMSESFSITNVAPQAPKLNRVYWEQLEEHVRKMLYTCDTLYVVTGTIVKNGEVINRITIPAQFYKAVVGVKNGKKVKSCAWIYDNNEQYQSIAKNQMSIDRLEKIIGINLFPVFNKGDRKIEARIYE